MADQGVVEHVLEEHLRRCGYPVDYNLEILEAVYETNHPGSWPIQVLIKNHTTEAIERWQTKYILGCDGVDSTIRRLMDIEVEYHGKEDVWAVADLSLDTDFPDTRRRSTIKSMHGNCTLMPGTENRTRITTPLTAATLKSMGSREYTKSPFPSLEGNKASATTLVRFLHPRLSAVLAPWDVKVNDVSWVSRYHNTKRLATQFSDSTHHIFLLGDACHTHSPLTNQSMNSGMMDGHNLAWKLAMVQKGHAKPVLLATYSFERRAVALQQVEFDVNVDHILTLLPNDSAIYEGFHDFEEGDGIISGCGVHYPPGLLVKEEVRVPIRSASEPLKPGKRLLPMTLTRHIDGNEANLLDELQWGGRFHLLVCLGDIAFLAPIFVGLSGYLSSQESPLTLFSHPSLLDVFLIHTHNHFHVSLPDSFTPFSRWPNKIYEDTGGKALASVGVNPKLGALALIRPDGHVAVVTNLDDARGITAFLQEFLNRQDVQSEDVATSRAPGDEMVL